MLPGAAEHLAQRQGMERSVDVRARRVAVGPVVSRADVLHPLRRVREARPLRPVRPPRAGGRWRRCRPPGDARPRTPPIPRRRSRSRSRRRDPCRGRSRDERQARFDSLIPLLTMSLPPDKWRVPSGELPWRTSLSDHRFGSILGAERNTSFGHSAPSSIHARRKATSSALNAGNTSRRALGGISRSGMPPDT